MWTIINNYSPKWRLISTTFTDTEENNCFSIYHTSWTNSGPKSNFICDNIPTKAILFFIGCSEVNSTWLITSELANQRARKVLFTCVVYTNSGYSGRVGSYFSGQKMEILRRRGAYVEFPPWWGYGYFLELHNNPYIFASGFAWTWWKSMKSIQSLDKVK